MLSNNASLLGGVDGGWDHPPAARSFELLSFKVMAVGAEAM